MFKIKVKMTYKKLKLWYSYESQVQTTSQFLQI